VAVVRRYRIIADPRTARILMSRLPKSGFPVIMVQLIVLADDPRKIKGWKGGYDIRVEEET